MDTQHSSLANVHSHSMELRPDWIKEAATMSTPFDRLRYFQTVFWQVVDQADPLSKDHATRMQSYESTTLPIGGLEQAYKKLFDRDLSTDQPELQQQFDYMKKDPAFPDQRVPRGDLEKVLTVALHMSVPDEIQVKSEETPKKIGEKSGVFSRVARFFSDKSRS